MTVRPALLLIDLQRDYLDRPGLVPAPASLERTIARLLAGVRALERPVIHVRTLVRPDGGDRMPHWIANDYCACVDGTQGAKAPEALHEKDGEPVVSKPFFSAFGNPEVLRWLRDRRVNTLVVAGVLTHACVRASVLDAYQAGLEVWVAADGVASDDPLHDRLTRTYLGGRAATFMSADRILRRLNGDVPCVPPHADGASVAFIAGAWRTRTGRERIARRNPSDERIALDDVPVGVGEDIDAAVASATTHRAEWARASRHDYLAAWDAVLTEHTEAFVELLAREVGKPVSDGRAEVRFARALLNATRGRLGADVCSSLPSGVQFRRMPWGTVGLITPWNNPLAIPVGKLAPALGYGNTVIWKPAPQAAGVARLLIECMRRAGFPPGACNAVFGDAETSLHLVRHPDVPAIAFTGSSTSGRLIASECAAHGKALQAELGGNNAVLVMPECDVSAVARDLAIAAFSFCGQRCTAPRRLIVHRQVRAVFETALRDAVCGLRIGDPAEPDTRIGPVISREDRERVAEIVAGGVRAGGKLLCGGRVPPEWPHGFWYEPTVVADPPPDARIVTDESFGPVVVLMEARDLNSALDLCNAVPQGLVATMFSHDDAHQARFLSEAQAGMLRINDVLGGLDPDAPFVGWKDSGLGPPEHGSGDLEFYTRPQSIYRG